jgi:hypothetical protein
MKPVLARIMLMVVAPAVLGVLLVYAIWGDWRSVMFSLVVGLLLLSLSAFQNEVGARLQRLFPRQGKHP